MNRTLQDEFLGIFELGGIFDVALSVKAYSQTDFNGAKEEIRLAWDRQNEADKKRLEQFREEFNEGMLYSPKKPLMREIEDCLNSLSDIEAQKRYVTSIILRLTDISNLLYPHTSHIDNEEIAGKALDEANEYLNIHAKAYESDVTPIEIKVISQCVFLYRQFVDRLDALCLTYLIDIDEIQNDTGIKLRPYRLGVGVYVGSYDYAEKLLNEIKHKKTQPNPPQKPSAIHQVASEKRERSIDSERLKPYFSSAFKGSGNGSINYFEWMIDTLKTERSIKENGQIALMIWESSQKSSHLNAIANFSEWHKIFCECVGCDKGSYDKNKLRNPSDSLKNLFNYL